MATIAIIRSGGQSGADRGALDAARAAGLPICGWCPAGGWAEDYPDAPGIRALYPELAETPSSDVIQRTEWNVRDSDATLIICPRPLGESSGTFATREFAHAYGKPHLVTDGADAAEAIRWLDGIAAEGGIDLNVAGPRESGLPGICEVSRTLVEKLLRARTA